VRAMTDSRCLCAAALDLKVQAGPRLELLNAVGKPAAGSARGGRRQYRRDGGGRRGGKGGGCLGRRGRGGQGPRDFGRHGQVKRAFLAAAGQQGSCGHNGGKAMQEAGIAGAT